MAPWPPAWPGCGAWVHTEHDAWHLQDPRRRRLQHAILTLTRPRLVADSAEVTKAMRAHLPGWPVEVIGNGIDTDHFTPGDRLAARAALALPPSVDGQTPLIGCAARLHPVKGHRFLIDAMALLPIGVHLALAGNGKEEAALRTQVANLGLAERVHFLGRIDEMLGFDRAIDLSCLPSLAEGMPLSPLEAQACGVAVVVTDVGGAREGLCPVSGRWVPAGDAPALAQALGQQLERTATASPGDFVLAQGDARAMVAAYARLYR